MAQKIWFITGISSGLGKALAAAVIASGDFVIGTFREPAQADAFTETYKDNALGLVLDVTNEQDVAATCRMVEQRFGRLDVLVNNAGFGFAGAIEEASVAETRAVFEANFFGTLQVTQQALPMLRRQKSGHIVQISSHGGFKAIPGFGIYNASKFAVEGFSEALAQEVAPLGIKVTIVEPGPSRTAFAGSAFREAQAIISDYSETAGAFRQRMKAVDGRQEGHPEKAAQAIISIAQLDNPPLRLPLGKIAVASITAKLNSVTKDLADYRQVAESVVYE